MKPIGIFGGTFDPVHFGHLRAALELLQDLGLQEIRFVPCRVPPHRAPPVASPEQRLRMLQAALHGAPGLTIDTRELQRHGPSYSVDTLQALRAELRTMPLCLILGLDAFRGICDWHRWEELPELAHLVIAHRPGVAQPEGRSGELLAAHRVEDPAALCERPAGHMLLWPVTQLEISASAIRALVGAGKSPRWLMPDAVCRLVARESLYSRSGPGEGCRLS